MDKPVLIKPNLSHKDEILSFKKEMLDFGSDMDGTGALHRLDTVEEWLEMNKNLENKETVIDTWVECEQFAYLRKSDNKIVGMIQFRHYFNDFLENYGGHIGYSVRPLERQKGYAKQMLKDCMKICKEFGLDKILVTCDKNNIASKKTILANGGEYEKTVFFEPENIHLERYWIKL